MMFEGSAVGEEDSLFYRGANLAATDFDAHMAGCSRIIYPPSQTGRLSPKKLPYNLLT